MKKILIRLLVVLVLLLLVGAVAVHLFLDSAIKRGVETVGPKLTKVSVKLSSVNLMLLSGSGKVNGLVIGNPEGFKSPSAISVGSTSVELLPQSLLTDKVVIRSINVQAPEVTFETGLNVKENNLNKILANLDETTGGSEKEPTAPKEPGTAPAKKLQVDDFLITGAKVHVTVTAFGNRSATLPIPDIHLKNLGQGPEGITPAELTKVALQELEKEAAKAALTAIDDLSKGAVYMSKEFGGPATNTIDKATKGIGDLFKKKK
jgi:hypothetical protein